MDAMKIDEATALCLSRAFAADRPFVQVAEFLSLLQTDAGWTDKEIIEVQTRVIRELMKALREQNT
jgi:hypothetical protein